MTREKLDESSLGGKDHRFMNILIGTSLTAASDEIVGQALTVARALGSRVRLVHVMPVESISSGIEGVFGVDIFEDLKASRESDLARQLQDTKVLERELIGADVLLGVPDRALAELALEANADLIIVGASEEDGSTRRLLGSTTDRLIRSAHCPVLILRSGMPIPPRRVLAPIDFSSTSALAIEAGVCFLKQMNADSVTAIRALFVVSDLGRQLVSQSSPQQVDRMAKEELLSFTFEHTAGWDGGIESTVRLGDARHQLLKELDDRPADLVVVGSHGHGALHRALIGSVAGRIVRRASCSVLFVPFEEEKAAVMESRVESRHADVAPPIESDDHGAHMSG
jgi:nucleotide-binding universal stress UspA family protein